MNYFDVLLAKKLEDDRDPKVEGLSVTENGRYHEDGVVYDPVIVNVPETPLSKLTVTENGTYTAPTGTAYSEVDVDVPLPSNAYLLKEIEDVEIASFTDGSDLPMPKLEVAIEPVQEGSGDPSPENVRPIIGWDEVDVTRTGKNLLSLAMFDNNSYFTINGDGSVTQLQNDGRSELAMSKLFLKKGTYTFSRSQAVGLYYIYSMHDGVITWYIQNGSGTSRTFTLDNDDELYIKVSVGGTSGSYPFTANYMIEKGDEATIFEKFNGHTYTLDLGGTRYGGKVDLVSGVMTITHEIKKVNTLNWYYLQNTFYTSSVGISADGSPDINSDFVCSFAKSVNKEWSQLSNNECTLRKNLYSQGYYSLCVKNTEYSDATDFKNSLDSTSEITFPLATPLTIQLTPTQVKSLQGINNVFADSGNILDLSYLAKEE